MEDPGFGASLAFLLMLTLSILTPSADSHPGDTDPEGCHICHTNCAQWGEEEGKRHCHEAASGGGDSGSGVSSESGAASGFAILAVIGLITWIAVRRCNRKKRLEADRIAKIEAERRAKIEVDRLAKQQKPGFFSRFRKKPAFKEIKPSLWQRLRRQP